MGGETNDIAVREADERDVERLCELYREFHEFYVRAVPDRLAALSPSDQDERQKLSARIRSVILGDNSTILVATLASDVIGLAEVYMREDEPTAARVQYRFGYLQSMVVRERARGKGAGRVLLDATERWTLALGGSELRLDVWELGNGPLGFYKHCGYRTLRRTLIRSLE